MRGFRLGKMKIDMQTMRYINFLNKISNVKTRKCFVYNNIIIFAVPSRMVSRAIGPKGNNIRIMKEQLGKKIRIIKESEGLEDAERFIEDIVEPVTFVSLEIRENEIVLTAGARSKAALLGRNKRRYVELKKIIEANFRKDLRIV